jgi:cytoskeletal protein CcmA (bactofilin family)
MNFYGGGYLYMEKKFTFSQDEGLYTPLKPAKKEKFSSLLRELMDGTQNEKDSKDVKKNEGKKGKEIMQLANGMVRLDETKKADEKNPVEVQPRPLLMPIIQKPKEESYISSDLVINGSISSVTSIKIDGTVNGDVSCDNDILVCGKIEGDVTAANVSLIAATVKGNIICKNVLSFDKDAQVIGNASGKKIEINGKITGNIIVEESAVVLGNATINGDIKAGTISVFEGATIKGNIQIEKSVDSSLETTAEVVG